MEIYNLVSLAGVFLLMAFAYLFSWNRKIVNFRLILWGLAFQMLFALFIFVFPVGSKVFLFVNDLVNQLIQASSAGARFVFGPLALGPGNEGSIGFILAFQALPTIVFFSALVSLLYYYKIMPVIIQLFARFFSRTMKISGAESLSASSNIFVGVESMLTIKPYLEKMTRSELGTVLTAGMATVASNVLAFYVLILGRDFPTLAGHLISASILSAPAAVIMAKLIMPETESPETMGLDAVPHYERESNFMEAIIRGSNEGMKLIFGIVALLLSVLGLVELMDMVLQWFGSLVGMAEPLTLRWIFGIIFYPFVLILGVPPADALSISKIVGGRLIVTEVTAYQELAGLMSQHVLKHPRSALIAAYALCGFAHVASLSIFVGGASALVPSRAGDLAKVGFRSLLAATLATMMTAAVAGTFYTGEYLLQATGG